MAKTPAISSVLRQYKSVLLSLKDITQTDASNTGVTARGLLERFGRDITVLGHMLATEVIKEVKCPNCTLDLLKGEVNTGGGGGLRGQRKKMSDSKC